MKVENTELYYQPETLPGYTSHVVNTLSRTANTCFVLFTYICYKWVAVWHKRPRSDPCDARTLGDMAANTPGFPGV